MPKARFSKHNPELLAIARLVREARELALHNRFDLLSHLFGMVECEIDDLIESQNKPTAASRSN